MVYLLPLPKHLRVQGWKIKIRNLERTEDPHVAILWKTYSWRYNIRRSGFMDREPDPREVPIDVVAHIQEHMKKLQEEWDKKHPHNPIGSRDSGP